MKPRRLGVFDQGTVDKRRLAIRPYIEAAQVVQANLGSRSGWRIMTMSSPIRRLPRVRTPRLTDATIRA
jgi:hypothetical protein